MTLASIIIPQWILWSTEKIHYTYGLHQQCTSVSSSPLDYTPSLSSYSALLSHAQYLPSSTHLAEPGADPDTSLRCQPFDEPEECAGPDRTFCSLWRTIGFLMSFAVVIELAVLVVYALLMLGGKQRRQRGWIVLIVLLAIVGAVQILSMGLAIHVFRSEDRFFDGWKFGMSFYLATASWAVQLLNAGAVTIAALTLEEEGGYELIQDRPRSRPITPRVD